jgi:predicted MarR family transcription regulator
VKSSDCRISSSHQSRSDHSSENEEDHNGMGESEKVPQENEEKSATDRNMSMANNRESVESMENHILDDAHTLVRARSSDKGVIQYASVRQYMSFS